MFFFSKWKVGYSLYLLIISIFFFLKRMGCHEDLLGVPEDTQMLQSFCFTMGKNNNCYNDLVLLCININALKGILQIKHCYLPQRSCDKLVSIYSGGKRTED